MIQLYAYDNQGDKHLLDLYDELPILLNSSVDDTQDVTMVTSDFTRQFRMPATAINSKFFKWWYTAGAIDFDVTKKISAEIHVDGLLFKNGHMRLMGAYLNNQRDIIELEVVFMGETKDFATQVGEVFLNELDLTSGDHIRTLDSLEDSWLPFDLNPLKDGIIRYIVADRGYEYDENGDQLPTVPGENPSEIAFANTTGASHADGFFNNAHPLLLNAFTPIIQVKFIIDQIFARTSYGYSAASVFNEEWFRYLYTDGLGTASPYTNGVLHTCTVKPATYRIGDSVEEIIEWTNKVSDPANSFDTTTFRYNVGITEDYSFDITVISGDQISFDGGGGMTHTIRLYRVSGGVTTLEATDSASGTGSPGQAVTLTNTITKSYTGVNQLLDGDYLYMTIEVSGASENPGILDTSSFVCTLAPEEMSIATMMKDNVTAIDFLKGILTRFKLLMVPNPDNATLFDIKPWVAYIGYGDRLDWTHKLDGSKDIEMKPLFFDNAANLIFTDQEDEDSVNKYHQWQYSEVYGTRTYSSNNELLKDTKTVDTVFAPTPCDQVVGANDTSEFIIPFFSVIGSEETDHGHLQRLPMAPKPRLLFWNGLHTGIPTPSERWHYSDGTTNVDADYYPRATSVSEIPTTATSLNLSWEKDFQYFSLQGGPEGLLGSDVYQTFWKQYIDSLYNPEARIMSAYFILDNEDLRTLSFDDAIFIKDSWWRLNKIVDAPIGDVSSTKIELIKLINFDIDQEEFAGFDFTISLGGLIGTGPGSTNYYRLSNCDGVTADIIASTTFNLPIGTVVSVTGSGYVGECWTVADLATAPADAPIAVLYESCLECGYIPAQGEGFEAPTSQQVAQGREAAATPPAEPVPAEPVWNEETQEWETNSGAYGG